MRPRAHSFLRYLVAGFALTLKSVPPNIVVQRADIDASRFPVVVVTEGSVLLDLERVQLMEGLESLLDRRGRHALVLDLSKGAPMPAAQRIYVAEALEMRAEVIADKWAAIAVVVRQPVLQHMTVAAFWLKVATVPARMFAAREDAITWARGCVTLSVSGAIPILAGAEKSRANS